MCCHYSSGITSTATSSLCSAPPSKHTIYRADIAEVAAPCNSDVAVRRNTVVGRIEIHPSGAWSPCRAPRVGCVGSHQTRLARRRKCSEITTYVARGQPKRTQTGDLQMREILADAAPLFEERLNRRTDFRGLVIESKIPIDPMRKIAHAFEHGPAAPGTIRARTPSVPAVRQNVANRTQTDRRPDPAWSCHGFPWGRSGQIHRRRRGHFQFADCIHDSFRRAAPAG